MQTGAVLSDIKNGLNITQSSAGKGFNAVGGSASEHGLYFDPLSSQGLHVTGAGFSYPVWKKCPFCGDFYKIDLGKDTTPKTLSKPGAALHVQSVPFPIGIQEEISHNFKCPVRPGGVKFSVWLKYKIRKFVEYWLS